MSWDARFVALLLTSTTTYYLCGLGIAKKEKSLWQVAGFSLLPGIWLSVCAIFDIQGKLIDNSTLLTAYCLPPVMVIAHQWIGRARSAEDRQKAFLWLALVINLALLGFFKYFNFHHVLHPFLKSTLNRKMTYSNYSSLFAAYRNKNIFSKIDDENLTNYINSIVTKRNNHVEINYPKQFEYEIYNSGLSADNYIWKNLNKLNIPILILRAENSNAFLPQAANRIKKINKKINIITLKDTTHLFPLEKPDETANHIITFLKKII